ncbi:MAG: gluconokinase [Verrucomicrobiota bacterium]|nr:gluconokinase [Verrucomicrobiota bacterium]
MNKKEKNSTCDQKQTPRSSYFTLNKNTYILMGVCGCGKSTIGALLAIKTQGIFMDGDIFHSKENVRKMSSGMPLNDEDREDWLNAISESITSHADNWPLFFGCSALKRQYRELLNSKIKGSNVHFIHLKGNRELISERMQEREGHFMKSQMIESQFKNLEDLEEGEKGFSVLINNSPEQICREIIAHI